MNLLLFNSNTDLDHRTQAFTISWVNELSRYFEYVCVLTLRRGRLDVAPNVDVWSVGTECGFSRPRRVWEFYRALGSILRSHRIDVCFSHMSPLLAVLGWPLLRSRGIPILLWYGHRATPILLRIAHRLVDGVVTSAPNGFCLLSTKVTIIGQGVDTDHFRPVRLPLPGTFVITTIGRISPIKNIETLLDAVRLLRDGGRVLGLRVRIIGAPGTPDQRAHLDRLRRKVQGFRMGDVVRFEGSIPFIDAPQCYHGAAAAYNGCPTGAPDKAGFEAMSCGVPTVVINESYRDTLGDAYDWLCVPSGEPTALAAAYQRIHDLRADERQHLSTVFRERVIARHSVRHATEAIRDILHELITRQRA